MIPLRPGEVHVWLVRTGDAPAPSPAQWAMLDGVERARAGAFRFARDRDAYVVAHAWLRTVLARHTGLPPDRLSIAQDRLAKPCLRTQGGMQRRPFFNLSHTQGLVAVAVAAHCDVGVDVERIRPWPQVEPFVDSVLHAREIDALGQLPAEDQGRYFFGVWCAKEAYTKATGWGLAHPFDSFDTGFDAAPCALSDIRHLNVPGFPPACLQASTRLGAALDRHALAVAALGPCLGARVHVVCAGA